MAASGCDRDDADGRGDVMPPPVGPRARFTVRYLDPTGLPLRDCMTYSESVASAYSQNA